MVKYQKNNGVFTKIIGTDRKKHLYDIFLASGEKYQVNDQIKEFTGIYEQLVKMNEDSFIVISRLEELIMQLRHLDDFRSSGTVKFSVGGTNNNFIYGYTKFYRHGYQREDFKVIVGKTEIYGADHRKFVGNSELVDRAKRLLENGMNETIRNTEQLVDNLLQKKFGNNKITM